MSTLRGSNINPSTLESPYDRFKIKKEGTRPQRKALKDRLAKYKAFQKTENGVACAKLADPMIAHCNHILGLNPIELGQPLDVMNDYKASIRGQREVWQMIKDEPGRLQRLLEELGKEEEEEEKDTPGWATTKKS